MGIETDKNGIVVYGPVSTRHVGWDEIAGLGVHRWGINREVLHLELVDGRKLETNLIQGRAVTWQDGKTKDIKSVLRSDLQSHGVAA